MEDIKKWKIGSFTGGFYFLGDEGETETRRIFRDGSDLQKSRKVLENQDNYPSIYFTGVIYRLFRNFSRAN